MAVKSEVEQQVAETIAAATPDVDLREIQVVGRGDERMLRLVIDHPSGVDHGLCVAVTQALDAAGLRERFGIEVSSPGPEPPLRTIDHYRSAVGDRVRLGVRGEEDRRTRTVSGVLSEVEADRVQLVTADGERWIAFDQIQRGRVVERSEG